MSRELAAEYPQEFLDKLEKEFPNCMEEWAVLGKAKLKILIEEKKVREQHG